MYYSTDYKDTEKRRDILTELLGGIEKNVAIDTPFHCDYGKNSVIEAGIVVTRSIPENSVAVGNPCRVIRQFECCNTVCPK